MFRNNNAFLYTENSESYCFFHNQGTFPKKLVGIAGVCWSVTFFLLYSYTKYAMPYLLSKE